MLLFIASVIMKILEFASGRIIDVDGFARTPTKKKHKRQKKHKKGLSVGHGMTTVDELSVSPASDCNSNNVDVSYNSITSDAEFIQDNSDYQWFTEYGYSREVQHHSVLSSGYDELARDLDSQLALVDMEDYSAQEILSTLPAMCCTDGGERQGEMYASVSGSLMESESEPLFSPVKECPLPSTNYSVDSLDCGCEDLVLTCQASNKHNYTIAFHGSTVMADTSSNQGDSVCSSETENKKDECNKDMASSESAQMTWSKVQAVPNKNRHGTASLPDLAPNTLFNSFTPARDGCVKLYDVHNKGSLMSESYNKSVDFRMNNTYTKQENFSLLRLFIAQKTHTDSNTSHNDNDNRLDELSNNNREGVWSESVCLYEDSLVKQESGSCGDDESSVEKLSDCKSSICTCSLSTSSHRFNVNNNNSFEREVPVKKQSVKVGTSTSDLSSSTNTSSEGQTVRPSFPRCPVHCMDRSMQTSQTVYSNQSNNQGEDNKGGNAGSPVYVLYPNYTLPDLGFLRHHKFDLDQVLLTPLKYPPSTPVCAQPQGGLKSQRPPLTLTSHHINTLKQKGVGHVMDWSSLAPLLPSQCWSLLADFPEVKNRTRPPRFDKPQFSNPTVKENIQQQTHEGGNRGKAESVSGSSQGTSGYRGSSTLLTDSMETKQSNPLYIYNYSSSQATQPQKAKTKSESNGVNDKRFSMFEFPDSILDDVFEKESVCSKRKSLPPQTSNAKDYKWEEWSSEVHERSLSPPARHALRLDHLLNTSNATYSLEIDWHPNDVNQLRQQVSKFLSENNRKVTFGENKLNDQQKTPPNSPAINKSYQMKPPSLNEYYTAQEGRRLTSKPEIDNKKALVDRIVNAVSELLTTECEVADAILSSLCPSLYAFMSDGLKVALDTPFGPIGNSVWQVVESSAHQGLVTKALNDLVMKLNNEDILSEGLIKFNAFIFGLLNVGGLDAWVSYIRTRESVLSKHYNSDALLLTASQGNASSRHLTDVLITALKPLARHNFNLDLLYETRLLHTSLLQLSKLPVSPTGGVDVSCDSLLVKKIVQSLRNCGWTNVSANSACTSCDSSQSGEGCTNVANKRRPRSCIEAVTGTEVAGAGGRKRWSGVHMGSKLASAFDSLAEQPDTPTCGAASVNENQYPQGKFKSLQRKWELLSNRSSLRSPDLSPVKAVGGSALRSRIPVAVTSPVRPTGLPVGPRGRVSRMDGAGTSGIQTSRPASLPHSRGPSSAGSSQNTRRAASSSNTRKPSSSKPPISQSNRSRIPVGV